MARRPFGHPEDDSPPDMTFVEARALRSWILKPGPTDEIQVVTSRRGGVTRFLEQVHADIGGGFVRGRREEWLVTVVDLAQATNLTSLLIGLRNDVVRGADDLLGANPREQGFLAFDIAALFWWRQMRKGRPLQPQLHRSDLRRVLEYGAKIGLNTGLSGLFSMLGPVADAIANGPFGEAVGDRISNLGLNLAGKALRAAAGGVLLNELKKGSRADPDIILAALPELFLAGLKTVVHNPATGLRRVSRSGKVIRHLMIVDAAEELDSTLPFALRNVDAVAALVTDVAKLDDSRVLVGARDPVRRIEKKLNHPINYCSIVPFERSNVIARLASETCAETLIDSMIAALCPEDQDKASAWPLHLVWSRRFDLPEADVARDLSLLARLLGPGVKSEADLLQVADGTFGAIRTPQLLTELNRKPFVFIWNEGPGLWKVSDLISQHDGC